MAWLLPDQSDCQLCGQLLRPADPLLGQRTPVRIEEDYVRCVGPVPSSALPELSLCRLYDRKRISTPQDDCLKVKTPVALFQQAAKQSDITALTLPLATDEDTSAPKDATVAPPTHPIWGIAPYIPLRYLR